MKRLVLSVLILCFAVGLVAAQDESEQPTERVYVSDDGTITFTYPPSWWMLRDEYNGFTLVSDPVILDRRKAGYDTLYLDEAMVSIILFPTNYAESSFGITGTTATERLVSLSKQFGENVEIGAIETLDNGFSRAMIRQGQDFEGMVALWDISDDLSGFAVMLTAPGNFDNAESTVNDILRSFQFSSTVEEILSIRQGGQDS